MADYNDDFLNWAPLGLAIWPLVLICIFGWEVSNLCWRRSKARKILGRGGPSSRQEFIFLFPGACKKCLSRDVVQVEYECLEHGDPGPGGVIAIDKGEYTECRRCRNFISGGRPDVSGGGYSMDRTQNRIYSPYLSHEQSETVRDLAG